MVKQKQMKSLRLLFGVWLITTCCQAQSLHIKEFSLDNSDISASTNRRFDQDKRPCALVKIQVVDQVDNIEDCTVIGDILQKDNTTWVYVPSGTTNFIVRTKNHSPITINPALYEIEELQPLCTYKLTLVTSKMTVSNDPDNPTDPKAQYELALDYNSYTGRERDGKKYHEWLVASAEQGYALAQRDYGKDLLSGNYCEKNPALGKQWLRKAADQGNNKAMYDLALELMHPSDSISPDYPEAIRLLEKAGNNGNGDASLRLGEMYAGGIWNDGKNVKRDKKKARFWYEKAITQGKESAKTGLRRL